MGLTYQLLPALITIVRVVPTLRSNSKLSTMGLSSLTSVVVLCMISAGLALKCYQCDGVRGTDLPCEGNGNVGREVECPDKCGLMLHQILHFDKWHSSVVSTDSRWRRGCTSDGSEITADSEMAGKSLSGDLGQLNCRQTTLTYLYSQAAR